MTIRRPSLPMLPLSDPEATSPCAAAPVKYQVRLLSNCYSHYWKSDTDAAVCATKPFKSDDPCGHYLQSRTLRLPKLSTVGNLPWFSIRHSWNRSELGTAFRGGPCACSTCFRNTTISDF